MANTQSTDSLWRSILRTPKQTAAYFGFVVLFASFILFYFVGSPFFAVASFFAALTAFFVGLLASTGQFRFAGGVVGGAAAVFLVLLIAVFHPRWGFIALDDVFKTRNLEQQNSALTRQLETLYVMFRCDTYSPGDQNFYVRAHFDGMSQKDVIENARFAKLIQEKKYDPKADLIQVPPNDGVEQPLEIPVLTRGSTVLEIYRKGINLANQGTTTPTASLQLKYISNTKLQLEFVGVRNARLGCPDDVVSASTPAILK